MKLLMRILAAWENAAALWAFVIISAIAGTLPPATFANIAGFLGLTVCFGILFAFLSEIVRDIATHRGRKTKS